LLARTRARVREAFADSLVPFEQILQALYAEPRPRTLERTPVFQVLLNVVDVGETERLWAQLGAQRVIEREPTARYELAVYAIRRPSGMRLAVLYDADRFEPAQGDALLEHLRQSLLGLLEHPQQRLSALALRRPHADQPLAPVRDELAYSRFVAVVQEQPRAIAIDMGTRSLTYAQLHARVGVVADRLRGSTRVGLLVREDEHMAAGMLAALALGVTYVPLDPRLPPGRLRELIADADPDTLLCTGSLAALAAAIAEGCPILPLEPPPHDVEPPSVARGHADDVAYLLYTSGSTGRPKAVMQSQANLLHHALIYAERLSLGLGDRVSLVASHAFDAAVMDIYGALLSGATLCPIDLHGEALVDLASALRERAITVFHATPTVVRHLLASMSSSARLEAVRAVVLGGEEAHGQDAIAIAAVFGSPSASALGSTVRLVNGLGPTECTLALQELVEAPPPSGSLAVGVAVPGVAVPLETPVGEQVALYGVGEIVLESPHLALGYWRRPRASERAFSQHEGRRRYRSGDLGRWLPGGRVGFVGRRGGFIKHRGHRIEPGEIEARLRTLPGVRAAAVVLHEAELLAFYVAHEPPPVEAELLRALADVLPSWMLPTRLLRVDALPQTPTGKLDRRALALLPMPRAPEVPEPPSSNAEGRVLAVWSDVLGHTPPRVDLDWFACGGDSLGAARLVRALERRLGISLTLAEVFEGCTIATLARRLDGHDDDVPIMRARIRQLADGPGEPWIFILPPGTRPELLIPLAARFGSSLWTIEPPSFGEAGPLPTIDAILAAITRALEQDGPSTHASFVLAGVSNGGLLACALAPSLPRARALVLFDSLPPELLANRPWSERGEPALLAAFVHALCGVTASFVDTPPEQRFADALACVREHDPSIDAVDLQAMYTRYCSHGERAWQLLRGLDLDHRGLPDVVTLIEARDGHSQLAQRWRARLPNLRVHTVPGEHLDMFTASRVDALAQLLRGVGC
jgi:amino acid adenylation domain-containing protein